MYAKMLSPREKGNKYPTKKYENVRWHEVTHSIVFPPGEGPEDRAGVCGKCVPPGWRGIHRESSPGNLV